MRARGYLCSFCRTVLMRDPHVDQEHATGRVRAVPCVDGNHGIGKLKDDPVPLRRAAAYVEGDVWRPIPVAAGVYRLPS
jgi:hypothetical protein